MDLLQKRIFGYIGAQIAGELILDIPRSAFPGALGAVRRRFCATRHDLFFDASVVEVFPNERILEGGVQQTVDYHGRKSVGKFCIAS